MNTMVRLRKGRGYNQTASLGGESDTIFVKEMRYMMQSFRRMTEALIDNIGGNYFGDGTST